MNRRRLALAALTFMAAATGRPAVASAPTPKAEVAATVEAALNAANKGDARALMQLYAPDCTYIDEFPPFFWTGPGSAAGYGASALRTNREIRRKDLDTAVAAPRFVYVSGDHAYVVEPVRAKATVGGRPYAVRGVFAFTLARLGGRWRITSQAWSETGESMNPYPAGTR